MNHRDGNPAFLGKGPSLYYVRVFRGFLEPLTPYQACRPWAWGAEGAMPMAPKNVCTSVNPISTRGAGYAPTSLLAPQTIRPSDGPALRIKDIFIA